MDALPVLLIALPFLMAVPGYLLCRRSAKRGWALLIATTAVECLIAGLMLGPGQGAELQAPWFMGLGLSLKADGFRALYAAVASFMWLMASLMTPQYMAHGHSRGRYLLFTLLTMGATVGVFLSDDLITALLFFEIMSFTSYCWVAHEQTAPAKRAAQTYLAIALLGGMAMLMGLMMLKAQLGSLRFEGLAEAAQGVDRGSLYLPGALILAGFGAKAGMFPLHVWLPKAHPVAPAPASALLSGVLTKVGIFGILVISSRLFFGDQLWGNLLLGLGLINMLLGATLALFSVDLKRTLACSSVSQIGFVLLGIGMQGLLAEHNALAAQGTVLHMLNHSLIKLCLFMAAGVVYMQLHKLDLNEIRGFGRRRYGLMLCFLVGAASLSGFPLFSGYASKTLLHESLIEYIVHLKELGQGAFWYQAAEWTFVLTGGLTFCYMIKLFVAIFIEKQPERQAAYDAMGSSMRLLSAVALGGTALVLFVLGLWPEGFMQPLANLALPFLRAHEPEHAVHFLAGVNLIGGAKSLLIGALLYPTLVRRWLMGNNTQGELVYLNRWPAWLDLENGLYRPFVQLLTFAGALIARPFDRLIDTLSPYAIKLGALVSRLLDALMDGLVAVFMALGTWISRLLESLVDGFSMLLLRTVLRRKPEETLSVPVGNRFTYTLGRAFDTLSYGFNRVFRPGQPQSPKYIYLFYSIWEAANVNTRRMLRTLSFSLMLFALGIVLLLAYLLIR